MHWWKYSVRAIWAPRADTMETATQRTVDCLRDLQSCHPLLLQWSALGPGGAPLAIEPEVVREQLLVAELVRNPTMDITTAVLPSGGCGRDLHSGADQKSWVMLSVRCGSWEPHVANLCRLDLPGISATTETLVSTEVLTRILVGFAKVWQPSYGNVSSAAYDQSVGKARCAKVLNLREPMAGWITYLAPERGHVPSLPSKFERIALDDGGTIIVGLREPLDATNPAHCAALAELSEILGKAGLMEPVYGGA